MLRHGLRPELGDLHDRLILGVDLQAEGEGEGEGGRGSGFSPRGWPARTAVAMGPCASGGTSEIGEGAARGEMPCCPLCPVLRRHAES